jgi:hypothetical protein
MIGACSQSATAAASPRQNRVKGWTTPAFGISRDRIYTVIRSEGRKKAHIPDWKRNEYTMTARIDPIKKSGINFTIFDIL